MLRERAKPSVTEFFWFEAISGPVLEAEVLHTHSKKGHVFVVRPLFCRSVKSCRRNCIVCLCAEILEVTESSLLPIDAKSSLGSDCVVEYHFRQFCRFALVRLKLCFLQWHNILQCSIMASDSLSQIVTEKLDKNNFQAWKFRMTNFLMGKGYWEFITWNKEPALPNVPNQ